MVSKITRTLDITEWEYYLADFPDNICHAEAWGHLNVDQVQKIMHKKGLKGLQVKNLTYRKKVYKMDLQKFVENAQEVIK